MAFEHYDKCSLLLPMDGANNGTTFTDWSPNPKTITRNGDAKTVTAQSKYYGSSGYFDGSGDYLTTPYDAGFVPGSGDFTVSAYIYPDNVTSLRAVVGTYYYSNPNTYGWLLYVGSDGKLNLVLRDSANNATTITSTGSALSINTWAHVGFVKRGAAYHLFTDGTFVGNATPTNTLSFHSSANLFFGICYNNVTTTRDFSGFIQDIFTPPTRLVGQISGNVKNAAGSNASRIIHAVPRSYPSRLFSTISDPSTGDYSLRVPATECSRIALADEATLYNDKVDRIIPE